MGFAGLTEPTINLLYNRSHKLKVSADHGQNYNSVLLGVVHGKTKSKECSWVLGYECGFGGFQAWKKCFYLFLESKRWRGSGRVTEESTTSRKSSQGLTGAPTWQNWISKSKGISTWTLIRAHISFMCRKVSDGRSRLLVMGGFIMSIDGHQHYIPTKHLE